MTAVAELTEPMWCPFSRRVEPHRLYVHEGGIMQWCQRCLRVHVYTMENGDTFPLLVPVAISEG